MTICFGTLTFYTIVSNLQNVIATFINTVNTRFACLYLLLSYAMNVIIKKLPKMLLRYVKAEEKHSLNVALYRTFNVYPFGIFKTTLSELNDYNICIICSLI